MTTATLPHAAALHRAGAALAAGDSAGQALCIIDDVTDRQEVLRQAGIAGGSRRAGIRTLRVQELLAPLPAGEGRDLPLLASMDRHREVRANAANVLLLARIYAFLRQAGAQGNLFALATAYRDILAEMNQDQPGAGAALPELARDHSAYAPEIAWLHQLWEQFCAADWQVRRARLTALAASLQAPVVHVHWRSHTPRLLREFLAQAAQTTSVTELGIHLDGTAADLVQLWKGASPATLDLRGLDCEFHAAGTLEQAATAALGLLGKWRHGGKKRIGVVGFNRQLVRRLHSLCLQHGILMVDRAGWLASNLLVGDVLLALTDPGHDRVARLRLLQLLARRLNGTRAGSWVWPSRDMLAGSGSQAHPAMDKLLAGWGNLAGWQSPAEWFAGLAAATERPPLAEFFAADLAAGRLHSQLHLLAQAFAEDEWDRMSPGELHRLLLDALNNVCLLVGEVRSDIQLVSPAQLSSQRFDALLLLGADAKLLPEVKRASLFNDSVRTALGLPCQAARTADLRMATASLVGGHACIAAVWHGNDGTSPYFELLEPYLDRPPRQPAATPAWDLATAGVEAVTGHQVVAGQRLPARLSPSVCDTLMACPYKFYAGSCLRLRQDTVAGHYQANEFGTFVHAVLEEFHQHKLAGGQPGGDNRVALRAATAACLARPAAGVGNRTVYAVLWESFIDAYAASMDELYAAGGRIASCEEKVVGKLARDGQTIPISFKCDRVDKHPGKGLAVVDAKTGAISERALATGEKPQLALYACLSEGSVPELAEIWKLGSSKGEHEVKRLQPFAAPRQDGQFTPQEIFAHMQQLVFAGIRMDQPLPANGATDTCRHCAFTGLCRRPLWQPAISDQPA